MLCARVSSLGYRALSIPGIVVLVVEDAGESSTALRAMVLARFVSAAGGAEVVVVTSVAGSVHTGADEGIVVA